MTGVINCDDYKDSQCYNKSSINTNVCCSGYQSCEDAQNITVVESQNNNYNISIRCDAYRACRITSTHSRSGFVIASQGNNAGNMYFTAYMAAYDQTGDKIRIISTTYEYDIFCTGSSSCRNQHIIRYGNNLYCTAHAACYNVDLISNFNNVYAYGQASVGLSQIAQISNNLYCAAYQSCIGTIISNIFNSVYGSNYRVLYQSNISNVVNNVVGAGYQALYESVLYNVTNIYCISNQSCKNSILRGVGNQINANGNNTLSGSIIISEASVVNSTALSVYINGTNDELFNIYCNITDICKIFCLSKNSCTNLVMTCGIRNNSQTCSIYCNLAHGINCPLLINGNYTIYNTTQMPTPIPTTIPSIFPTNVPSTFPTTIPTTIPTIIPSSTPTFLPTSIPTIIPSTFPTATSSVQPSTWPTKHPSEMTMTSDKPDDENSNNSSNSIFGDDATIIVILVAISGFVLVVCMCLLFTYFVIKSNNERYNRDEKMHNDVLNFVKKGNSVNAETQLTETKNINEKSIDLNNTSVVSSREPITENGNLSQRELMVNNVSANGEDDEDNDDDDNDDDNVDELYQHVQEGREGIKRTKGTKGVTQTGSDGESIVL